MVPSDGGSFLTFAITALLWEARWPEPWLQQATDWCWPKLEDGDELSAYWVKFALDFLDHVPDEPRANATIERLRGKVEADEPRPLDRSQIEADLDALEDGQQDDGGWMFDWLGWSAGQSVEWRGIVTLRALTTLQVHARGV
jgi:hypothetical protein